MKRETTPVVDLIGTMNFEGNIIPHTWYKTIKKSTGKADLLAIAILSEIVYWYRPVYEHNELGVLVKVRKKFKADALQLSYKAIADKLGVSERQTKGAIVRLEKHKVIKRDLREITVNGTKLSNVLFILLNPKELYRRTYMSEPSEWDKIKDQVWNDIPPHTPPEKQKEILKRNAMGKTAKWAQKYRMLDNCPDTVRYVSYLVFTITGFEPSGTKAAWVKQINQLWQAAKENRANLEGGLKEGQKARFDNNLTFSGPRSYVSYVKDYISKKNLSIKDTGKSNPMGSVVKEKSGKKIWKVE